MSLEQDMVFEDFSKLEELFESLTSMNKQAFRSYLPILEFYSELTSIEGLFENFSNLSFYEQIDLYEECYKEPNVLKELLSALDEVNSDSETLFKKHCKYSVEGFMSIIDPSEGVSIETLDILSRFALKINAYSTGAVFTTLALLYLKRNREDMLDLVARCKTIVYRMKLEDFVKLLNNWAELKEYPLDWALEIADCEIT